MSEELPLSKQLADLDPAGPLSETDLFLVEQDGVSKKVDGATARPFFKGEKGDTGDITAELEALQEAVAGNAGLAQDAAATAGAAKNDAQTAATFATNSAAAADQSETNAAASASSASSSATTAASSATSAAGSADAATTSAGNASGSETAAATSAAAAAASQVSAATSATNATSQASLAASAKNAAELARDAAILGAPGYYEDATAGLAATTDGDYFSVPSGDGDEYLILYLNNEGAADEKKRYPGAPALDTAIETINVVKENYVPFSIGKNLIDKSKIRVGYRYSASAKKIIATTGWRMTDFIPITAGSTYTRSGITGGGAGEWAYYDSKDPNAVSISNGTAATSTAPAGAKYLVLNITNTGATTWDGTAQIEAGSAATSYEPFTKFIPKGYVKDLAADLAEKLSFDDVLETVSHNRINPAEINYVKRYSIGSKTLTSDGLGIAASGYIPVVEGEFYTVSGAGIFGIATTPQGGYFANVGDTAAIDNITFVDPVVGVGGVFQVPTGLGIQYAIVSLRKLSDSPAATSLHGEAQLELGEMPTAYQAYEPVTKLQADLLPSNTPAPEPSGSFNAEAWYKFTDSSGGVSQAHKFPIFHKHWLLKDKDLCVVNTGTSLTARSDEHCTMRSDPSLRPPLMHSNNLASILWDKMRWEGQQYRRYDAAGFFTESGGTFNTATSLSEWDDGPYRAGYTRYSGDTGASVAFAVPAGAWQFNFIYRTDSLGVETNTVTVAEGNGKIEVFNGSAWVEANGFMFSMRESTPVTRSVSIPNPTTDAFSSSTIASKGNTTYQKRLKMRCKSGTINSLASSKAVTIAGTAAGRFMYWGVEWSPRQFMITYINAARGSHNTQATNTTGLPRFQDNEVWSFKPDLLFFELPIHNDGTNALTAFAANFWARLTNNFVFRTDYELSLKSRGTFHGLSPEIGLFTSAIAWNFGAIDDDGQLKFSAQSDGSMMTALDKFAQAHQWVVENHPEAVSIHAAQRWVDAGVAIHGNLRAATEASGKGGPSFTNEGSHWNDTGCKIVAKVLAPHFDFT